MFNTIVPLNAERQTRRGHRKSRQGCRTCKERKLKCDEVKPVCGNCLRHFIGVRPCEYPQPSSLEDDVKRRRPSHQSQGLSISVESLASGSLSLSNSLSDWALSLPRDLRAESVDPFKTHPVTRVLGIDELLQYYLKTAVYQCFPWQQRSDTNPTTTYYVPIVWSDPVLFHTVLLHSALKLEAYRGHNLSPPFTFLLGECIRLLRDRIETSDVEKGTTDQTISAVATLATIEHERNNVRMMRMHLEGLKRMIRLRGGLNAIRKTTPMVSNSVFCWRAFAVAMYEMPFPPLDPDLPPFFPNQHSLTLAEVPLVVSHFEDLAPIYSDSQPINLTSLGISPPIATIFSSIQHVSQLVPTGTSYPTAMNHLVILTRMCALLSHLLSISPVSFTDPSIQFSVSMSECARYAIVLHVFTPWRGLPPDGTLAVNYILHKLITSLSELPSTLYPELDVFLLWVYSVGGVSAVDTPERLWFVSKLSDMTEAMGIETWPAMKFVISRGIWHERICARPHEKLWDEVLEQKKLWA